MAEIDCEECGIPLIVSREDEIAAATAGEVFVCLDCAA